MHTQGGGKFRPRALALAAGPDSRAQSVRLILVRLVTPNTWVAHSYIFRTIDRARARSRRHPSARRVYWRVKAPCKCLTAAGGRAGKLVAKYCWKGTTALVFSWRESVKLHRFFSLNPEALFLFLLALVFFFIYTKQNTEKASILRPPFFKSLFALCFCFTPFSPTKSSRLCYSHIIH